MASQESTKRYANRHPNRLKEAQRHYRQSPKGRAKTAERNATELYKLAHRLRESFYRSRRHGYEPIGGRLSAEDWEAVLYLYSHRCAYCGAEDCELTVDHVVPISRGGDHDIDNVVPACGSCNSSKGDQILTEWLGHVAA